MKRICPNCAKFIERKLKVCPYCGKPVKAEPKEKKGFLNKLGVYTPIRPSERIDAKLAAEKEAKIKKENNEQIIDDKLSLDTDGTCIKSENNKIVTQNSDISNNQDNMPRYKFVDKYGRPRYIRKKERQKVTSPRVDGINIPVVDTFAFGLKGEYGAMKKKPKNNTNYELEKLKWWEIYRFADRMLARRKINKYVKKESVKKPENVSYRGMFILCLLTGYLGIHNIYCKNYFKGFFTLSCFMVSFVYVSLYSLGSYAWLNNFWITFGAFPGLFCILSWIWDLTALIFKRFRYKQSKLNYIKTLDVETRARLGKKYIYMV